MTRGILRIIVILRSVSDEGSDVYMSSHGRYGASKGLGHNLRGLFPGSDQRMARWNPCKQSRYVRGRNHLQEGIGGIIAQPPYLAGGVVERQPLACTERPNRCLIKPLFARYAEMLLVPEVNQPQNSPEVIDPVGVIEWHAPAMLLRGKTPQEQNPCALRKEWLKRMLFSFHTAFPGRTVKPTHSIGHIPDICQS